LLSYPVEFDVKADGSAEVTVLPIRSQLVLVMKMVGPIRRHEHTLSTVTNRLPAPEPSTGPSALVRLLKDAFPSLEEGGPAVVNCKVARMIQLDRDGLAPLSAAVDALTRAGQRAVFIKRIQQEHPTRRVEVYP